MIRSIFSNWLGLILIGVISFLLTPILIHGLGDFYFGMWVLVMSLLDYYGLLDLGIRTTLHRFVGRLKGMNERAALNETISIALAISFGISLFVAGLTVALMFILPGFFTVAGASRHVLQLLLLLLGLNFGVLLPARVLGAYLCGLQRFDLYNLGLVVTAIVRAVFIIAVLHLGYGVVAVALVVLGVALLNLLLNWRLVRFADPRVSLNWHKISWGRIREVCGFSFYAFLTSLGDYLRFYTDSAVIARVLTLALVTLFSVPLKLMGYFKEVLFAFAGPLMTRMSELDGQAKLVELRLLFLRSTKMAALCSFLIGGLLLFNGKSLLGLWIGERFVESYSLLVVLTVGYIVILGQRPSRDLLYAKARHRPLAWWTVAEGVANILLSIYWARRYGLFGVALGTVVPMLVIGLLVQPWYVLRLMGISVRQYLREALLGPLVNFALFAGLCHVLSGVTTRSTLGSFILTLTWQSCLYALLAYLIALTPAERQVVWQRSKELRGLGLGTSRTAAH